MLKNGIEIIYEQKNNEYHELFNADEEIKSKKKQKLFQI